MKATLYGVSYMPETQGWYNARQCIKVTRNFNRFIFERRRNYLISKHKAKKYIKFNIKFLINTLNKQGIKKTSVT